MRRRSERERWCRRVEEEGHPEEKECSVEPGHQPEVDRHDATFAKDPRMRLTRCLNLLPLTSVLPKVRSAAADAANAHPLIGAGGEAVRRRETTPA